MLVTNYREGGGGTKQEGGQVKFSPYKKGTEKVLAMLNGGGGGAQKKKFVVVSTGELEVLAIFLLFFFSICTI